MPTDLSPYRLFQERYRRDPWAILVCTVCLNQTTGRQFENVHETLFSLWPSAHHMALADISELESVVHSLGLFRKRARALVRLSTAFAFLWDGNDPTDLPNIGRYGADSYAMFVRNDLTVEPLDKELRNYKRWAMS